MNPRSIAPVALAFVLGGAAVFAATRSTGDDPQAPIIAKTVPPEPATPVAEPTLPPNHPPVGANATSAGAERDDPPSLAWSVPTGWKSVVSASAMRLATYRVPAQKGDSEDADVSVIRAGGSTDANIDRWIHQFEGNPKQVRTQSTVAGFKVTTVEVTGSFMGGGMMGGSGDPKAKPNWALLGAIVETQGSPYFFKMTGPRATVSAARDAFMAMLSGATKA